MTKGGVMIGRSVSTRSVCLWRKPVRTVRRAKARPIAVAPAPTRTARNTVFQATPQRTPVVTQPRPQMEGLSSLSISNTGAQAPALSCSALASMVRIGKNTKSAISATTSAIAPTVKASPRQYPRAANPRAASIR